MRVMGDEERFSEKWDFRRQENNFDDSSSDDDPDSNSTQDLIIHNPNLVLDSHELDDGTKTVTREQPVKTTRKRRSKKDESKPEKAKQIRRRKPKAVCAEEDTTKKKDETVMETDDDVGMFMKTLLDDLTASRESLMDWMKTELYGTDHNVASRPPLKKRAVASVATKRPVKKRTTAKKKKGEEEEKEEKEIEKQSKPEEICQEMMSKAKEKSSEIAQNNNGGDQVQELDYNAGPLDMFLKSSDHGRNYFQQQEQSLQVVTEKNATVTTNQKSVVLAIKAPKLSQKQKKMREASNINKNRASIMERTGSETQKDDANIAIPFTPKLSSSSPSLQSFPLGSSLSSLFPSSSSQGITYFASDNNNNFQLRQPPVTQIPHLSQLQTGFTGGGQGFANPVFHNNNNSYFSGFPTAFQPNLIASGYNFPAPVNPATSSQQRDNNNIVGGMRMAGGAIRLSGNRFQESQVGNCNISDYRK